MNRAADEFCEKSGVADGEKGYNPGFDNVVDFGF